VDKNRHLLILSYLPKLPERPFETATADADKRTKFKRKN